MKKVISEISATQIISRLIPNEWGLFIGSSMPIRDMNMYAERGSYIVVGANRGASGIDGTLSSATGFARALEKPVTVVLGDLALLHDLNALALAASLQLPLQIVVINNGGGGIFSFLPIAAYSDVLDRFFAAEHTWTFEYVAKMFNLYYMLSKTNREFEKNYRKALVCREPVLLEINTNRKDNYTYHKYLQKMVVSLIE